MPEDLIRTGDRLVEVTTDDYFSTYRVESVGSRVVLYHEGTGFVTESDPTWVRRELAAGRLIVLRGDRT